MSWPAVQTLRLAFSLSRLGRPCIVSGWVSRALRSTVNPKMRNLETSLVIHQLNKRFPRSARVMLNNELKLQPLFSDVTPANLVLSNAEVLGLVSEHRE